MKKLFVVAVLCALSGCAGLKTDMTLIFTYQTPQAEEVKK